MGRNAGWLTGAAALANYKGLGADLIYLPEVAFDVDKFVDDVKAVCAKNNNKCIAVISEGIKNKDGKYIGEFMASSTDLFGHAQLGGVCFTLANIIKERTGIKVRPIEFSLLQRCAAHLASKVDVEEAYKVGSAAVKYALQGCTDKIVVLDRDYSSEKYKCRTKLMPVSKAANAEKTIPLDWITNNGTMLSDEYVKYALPLIQGDMKAPLVDGLPRFAKLKKVCAKK
jgi:6-phosphofructokinase 1